MARGKKGRGGRRGGGFNDNYGGTDNSSFYYYADRGNRGARGRASDRGGGGHGGETGGSFGGREHNGGNWRDGRNGGGDGWHGRRRSGGYAGFSTGSFGVMGDADSINRVGLIVFRTLEFSFDVKNKSDTQSPEALAAEVPLATVEDLRYETRETVQVREHHGSGDFVEKQSCANVEQTVKVSGAQKSAENLGGSSTALRPSMSNQAIQGEDVDVADGGCVTTVRESTDLPVQPEVGLHHGARVRSMSYHAMDPTEISSKVTSRRYLSSIVIDDNLRQTLTTNQSRLRPEMMGEDAANFGTTIERIVHPVASSSDVNLQTAVESGSYEARRSTVTENSGIMVDTERSGSEPSHRRVRSMSQSLLDRAKDVETMFTREEVVRSQRSIVRTLEEEKEGFLSDEEVQIRTVQNDGHFNNHRLSKLSIHTNNDEFFYVGGHPPSDGRTSLRSRGSMSRQSMHSTDFLAGSFAANNEWTDTMRTTASRQSLKSSQIEADAIYTGDDDEVFEDAAQAKDVSVQHPIPKIRINGRSYSGSSMTSSDYVTAQERLTSPDAGGEALDAMSPAHHERSSKHGVHSTMESECVTADCYTSSTHASDVALDHKSSANNVSCHTAIEPLGKSRSNSRESGCLYNEQDQGVPLNYEHPASHDVDTKAAYMSTSSVHTACDQCDRPIHSASHHNIRSSSSNVAYEEAPQQTNASLHASTAMLDRTGQSASRQNIRSSSSNVAYEEAPQQTHMSNASLHASTAMLDRTGLSASRQNIRSNSSNVAYEEAPQQTHMSTASLHASTAMLDRTGLSASRQNIRSNSSNVAYEEAPQQTHMSNASLHASTAMLDRTGQSASRQNIRSSSSNVAYEEAPQQTHMSNASLHASTAMLDRTGQSSSRQNIRSSSSNVAYEEAPQQTHMSNASLHASTAMLDRTGQSSSRQNIRSSSSNVAYEEQPEQSHMSNASLHASTAMLDRTGQSASRQKIHSSACNGSYEEAPQSNASLHASTAMLDRTGQSASRQNIHSSAYNVAYEEAPLQTHISNASLHASSAMLDRTGQSASRQNIHSSACNVAYEEAPQQTRMSNASLHTSNAMLDRKGQSASRQNIRSSSSNVAHEEAPQQTYMSNASLHASTAMLDRTGQSASRQNIRSSSSNVAHEEAPQQTYMSNASLHASTAMLDRTGQSASRQNIHSSACNVPYEEPPEHTRMSNASLHASNAMLDRTGLSASRQNICSSCSNVAYEEAPQQTHMSNASLHASNAMLDRTGQSASRQNIHSSACNVPYEEPPEHTRMSNASLHASNAMLDRTGQSASRQNICSSCSNVAYEEAPQQTHMSNASLHASTAMLDRTGQSASRQNIVSTSNDEVLPQESSEIVVPKADPAEKPPMRISMASNSPISRSVSCCSTQSDVNNNAANNVQASQVRGGEEIVIESAVESAPKPAVRRSLQMIPDAVSHSSSRSSVHVSDEAAQNGVHVFKTSDGGFWYHFSDNERGRSRSTGNTIPRRESTGGVSPLAPRSETIPRTPPKKPPRSRSSSAASRNEVHFSSIPQLHSHPDDRFGVEVSGEPFRPASEHELTPHAQKIGSRSDVTAADETSTQKPQEAVVDLDSGMMTVPVHEKANSEVSSNVMNPPSRTPSLKSVDSIPSPLVVTDALTPKRAPYELKDDEDYNSPASFNRTLFSREAFQRRRFRERRNPSRHVLTGFGAKTAKNQ
ncbi:hypothetical protein Y032_0147g2613 [Ancylostoma ceylanicum]|uniref:Uncharacterized protein n=1 Tax=Ancylostoma ceylanicum TaxID=53326 RepID=A0A016T282_9BILA|nr:hypothetical protein Y032_0147g2613 [Ancylostoma ceylanicum]